eukprot:296155-Chlamydomonas_euryale.AAC.1
MLQPASTRLRHAGAVEPPSHALSLHVQHATPCATLHITTCPARQQRRRQRPKSSCVADSNGGRCGGCEGASLGGCAAS